MNAFCVKCKKDTEDIDPKMFRTKGNRLIVQSKCPVCRNKKAKICERIRSKEFIE